MISKLLDWLSNYLAKRKGLLPLIGIALITLNFILWFLFPFGDWWLRDSNFFLHMGVIIAIFGMMLAWAL